MGGLNISSVGGDRSEGFTEEVAEGTATQLIKRQQAWCLSGEQVSHVPTECPME